MISAIVSSEPQIRTPSGVYLSPTTWKSFAQWWTVLRRVRLLQPARHAAMAPEHWIRVPETVEADELLSWDRLPGFCERWRLIKRKAPGLLRDVRLLDVRLPSYESYYVWLIARHLGIPTVTELHGDWHEGVLREDKAPLLKRITRRYRANRAFQLYKDVVASSLGVVAIGPILAQKYVPPGKPLLITANHIVDEADYVARKDFTLKKRPRILFVGELQYRKGLQYLLPALAAVKAGRQDFEFVVVGADREDGAFQRMAKDLELTEQVTFLGTLTHGADLFTEYQKADIFVLPSICAEGVPRVLQESMSLGCPAIATDVGSTRWLLCDGKAGLVVPPADAKSLEEALRQLLQDYDLRQRLSQNAFAAALEFSYEKQSSDMASFIKSIVSPDLLTNCSPR